MIFHYQKHTVLNYWFGVRPRSRIRKKPISDPRHRILISSNGKDKHWTNVLSIILLSAHWSGSMLIQLGSHVSAHAYDDCPAPGSHMVTGEKGSSKCRLYWCFCSGWCSNFVGSESGQKQSVKLLQNMVYNTTQHPPPHPNTVCSLWEGGRGWGRSERR
jgi:hypothetical protein